VIREAAEILRSEGIATNQLHFKYLLPFHAKEALEILKGCRKTVGVEVNYTGQFAKHLRSETGFSLDDMVLKYDGEPFEPAFIVNRVKEILGGESLSLEVTREEAREIAYHYIRTHLSNSVRPASMEVGNGVSAEEPTWCIELVSRKGGEKNGDLFVGQRTGSTYAWKPVSTVSRD